MTRALVEGGVDILQLRAKKFAPSEVERLARLMLPVTRDAGVPLVINDHPRVAAAVGSEGVHVGQDDSSVAETRAIVGASCFVGKSTHSIAQARAALAEGADYIGFGPLFATGTKPDYIPIGLGDIAEVHRFATGAGVLHRRRQSGTAPGDHRGGRTSGRGRVRVFAGGRRAGRGAAVERRCCFRMPRRRTPDAV